ncbi:hypothetical protein KIN20_032226 [Parelaphostrongylus tenuis]|uniref:Uncharacterized protein n=1 Tax=Parelaphostrongylus tenuis TaxID=148309 RepID=A0AAD5R6Y0_PARTN|nr:hypothetical protein KIN20_032226 [Parelaphostrongylus tenuis]
MSSPTASVSTTSRAPHKNGAFDMDENAVYRAIIVIGGIVLVSIIYCLVKCCRSNSIRSRVRKYDLMSDRDLQQTALTVDSDSEDDLFEPPSSDRQKLVTIGSS